MAATTPSMMAPRTPWRSISARPAAAVPPGEVTIRRSALAGMSSSRIRPAVPVTVVRIRARASA